MIPHSHYKRFTPFFPSPLRPRQRTCCPDEHNPHVLFHFSDMDVAVQDGPDCHPLPRCNKVVLKQSHQSKLLLVYQPPQEFFDVYSQFVNHVWRGLTKKYGEVEAGLYQFKTPVTWLIGKSSDLQQCLCSSFLFSPTRMLVILICTDDMLIDLPEYLLTTGSVIEKNFTFRG